MIPSLPRPHPRLAWRAGALALGLLASACAARAAIYTALSDAIPYASWNATAPQMDDIWTANSVVTPVLASGYFTLGNGVIHKTLPVTATQNFEVRADVLHGAYQRSLWIGIFNSAGTQGYAFLWNSGASGEGTVSIKKYTVAGPASLLFNTYGTTLGSAVASGHPATSGSPAQLKLTWTASTSTLALSVDGVVKSTVVDASYALFSRVFIAGNDSASPPRFDNVTVTIDDSTAPTVSLTAPSAGATVSGTVSLSASASDVGLGMAGVQFKLNNVTNIGAEDTTSSYGVSWNTTTLENGVYQLTATARDIAGNLTTSAPISVYVYNYLAKAGAVVPWTYYEAETANSHTGTVLTGGSFSVTGNAFAPFEARGKKCVTLDAGGEKIVWNNVVAANRLTVRYNLASQATTTTIELWVNGVKQTDLALTGARTREPKPADRVAGETVRFWDDTMVAVTIPNNATVELRHGTGTVPINIDFLELETAPPPLSAPDGTWVSVASGSDDARERIKTAIATANLAGGSKKVWFPAGTYTVEMGASPSETIQVPSGTEMRGAGIWHTKIVKDWSGETGRLFSFYQKTGIIVRDLKVEDKLTTLSGNGSNCIFFADQSVDCVLDNIWSEYASLVSAYFTDSITVINCRVRNGYKDAVHIADTGHHGLIENCTFRNTGDDCAAFVVYSSPAPSSLQYNIARHNTMECTYWGRSVSLQGGDNNLAEWNRVLDGSMAGIHIALTSYSGHIYGHCTNFVVRNNVVVRCGNDNSNNHSSWAAISLYRAPPPVTDPVETYAQIQGRKMSGEVYDNTILASPFHASQLHGQLGHGPNGTLVSFYNNAIEAPTTAGGPPWLRKRVALSNVAPHTANCVHTPNTDL